MRSKHQDMSSPYSNLKRKKKTGILGSQRQSYVPFRHPEYSEDESKLLEEVALGMNAAKSRSTTPRGAISGGLPQIKDPKNAKNPVPPSDFDLMSTMMSRIQLLESQVQYQAKEIIGKDKKIRVLQDKIKLVEKSKADSDTETSRVRDLERERLLLKQQVHEMESFLADYGMVWVGEKSDPNSNVYYNDGEEEDDSRYDEIPTTSSVMSSHKNALWKPADSVTDTDFKVDYDLIVENIKELNVLAGEGIAKIQHTVAGAKLKMPDPIQLTLYSNGIMLFSGPFRPFLDAATQNCVQDLMEGYFPSELQSRYPDGIPFSVTDKRHVYFKSTRSIHAFEGSGQMLGGNTKPSRLVPSNLDNFTQFNDEEELKVETENDLKGHKLSADQFLKKLPSSVIKGGRVIDIRSSLGETMKGRNVQSNVTLVETEAVNEMKKRLLMDQKVRPATPRNLTTLRVKSEMGDSYILKMKFTDTLGDLRKYLNLQRPPGSADYKIMSAFPNTIYEDDSLTLEACGLTPNAALHLRPVKK